LKCAELHRTELSGHHHTVAVPLDGASGEDTMPATGLPDSSAVRASRLSGDEALALLAGVGLGRVVFSHHALPAIRPVRHVVDGNQVVILPHRGADVLGQDGREAVLCFQADEIDPSAGTGWSVSVTGTSAPVLEPAQLARYRRLLRPWPGADAEQIIRISTEIVEGYRLTAAPH
jgi:hypothetical protein